MRRREQLDPVAARELAAIDAALADSASIAPEDAELAQLATLLVAERPPAPARGLDAAPTSGQPGAALGCRRSSPPPLIPAFAATAAVAVVALVVALRSATTAAAPTPTCPSPADPRPGPRRWRRRARRVRTAPERRRPPGAARRRATTAGGAKGGAIAPRRSARRRRRAQGRAVVDRRALGAARGQGRRRRAGRARRRRAPARIDRVVGLHQRRRGRGALRATCGSPPRSTRPLATLSRLGHVLARTSSPGHHGPLRRRRAPPARRARRAPGAAARAGRGATSAEIDRLNARLEIARAHIAAARATSRRAPRRGPARVA